MRLCQCGRSLLVGEYAGSSTLEAVWPSQVGAILRSRSSAGLADPACS